MKDTFVGVPVKLNRKGIEKIVEVPLTADEKAGLARSADEVKANIAKLKL
jgi:malate dehydrogenase